MKSEWSIYVQDRVEHVLTRAGFVLTGQTPVFLKYRSPILTLKFVYDPRERSNNFFLGAAENDPVLFDEDILINVFDNDDKIDQVPVEKFVGGLLSFFQNHGSRLISGDPEDLQRLFDYQEERSAAYTARLVEKQWVTQADRYWESGEYDKFIDCIKQVNIDHLPGSYKLKLKIAMDKVK